MPAVRMLIHDRLEEFLEGSDSPDEFRDWFVAARWDIAALDEATRPFAAAIEHAFAEYSSGVTSEAQLRRDLAGLYSASPESRSESQRPHIRSRLREPRR